MYLQGLSSFSCRPREQTLKHTYEKYMVAFHEHLLLPVCESSNLGSLSYKCGPKLECEHCITQIILPYIQKQSKNDAEISRWLTMECPKCGHGAYEVNQYLGQVCNILML